MLPIEKRVQILTLLCEGASMRSISRVTGVSINTVTKLLVDAGKACAGHHDKSVREVKSLRVQCDEIWSFCYAKQKVAAQISNPNAGNVWTWTAIDADSKLIISYMVGGRDSDSAILFMDDLRGRLEGRVQLATEGHHAYLEAVEGAFGGNVDYAQLIKLYGPTHSAGRYSPGECRGARKAPI